MKIAPPEYIKRELMKAFKGREHLRPDCYPVSSEIAIDWLCNNISINTDINDWYVVGNHSFYVCFTWLYVNAAQGGFLVSANPDA